MFFLAVAGYTIVTMAALFTSVLSAFFMVKHRGRDCEAVDAAVAVGAGGTYILLLAGVFMLSN